MRLGYERGLTGPMGLGNFLLSVLEAPGDIDRRPVRAPLSAAAIFKGALNRLNGFSQVFFRMGRAAPAVGRPAATSPLGKKDLLNARRGPGCLPGPEHR